MSARSLTKEWSYRYHPLAPLLIVLLMVGLVTHLFGTIIVERIMTVFFINLMLVISLQMFMGNSGVFSFTHIGFMAIGAYASVLLFMAPEIKAVALPKLYPFLAQIHLPFLPALLIGAAVATLLAAIVSYPLMRLSGPASAIATFALLVIIHVVLINWEQVTNGTRTIFGVNRETTMWLSALWSIIFVTAAYLFKESGIGLKLRASREDEQAAATIGINIVFVRWVAFTLSIFVVGVAGGLWAHFITTFSPNAFYLQQTFLIVTMLIIGGTSSVAGAMVGTVTVTVIYEGLRAVENAISLGQLLPFNIAGATEVMLSIALILILIYRPAGIMRGQEFRWLKGQDEAEGTAEDFSSPAQSAPRPGKVPLNQSEGIADAADPRT